MQPYYFPYIGYFSHIYACDIFVFHDDVKYTKKGWINRNRIATESGIKKITLPLVSDSDSKKIIERHVSDTYDPKKQFRVIEGAYRNAPYWTELSNYLWPILDTRESVLSHHLFQIIQRLCSVLQIRTPLQMSSTLNQHRAFSAEDRVIAICVEKGAKTYLNPEGGKSIYNVMNFAEKGIDLGFISHVSNPYSQRAFGSPGDEAGSFIERLSILDTLAHLGLEETRRRVREDYEIERAQLG